MRHEPPAFPSAAAALLRRLLPAAEREEVLDELRREHAERAAAEGEEEARRWVWRQVRTSTPALLRRGWWRGWTDFQPRANRWQPGGAMLENAARDLRYAFRRLWKHRTYTLVTALTLALGVAGSAAVYSIARQLLQPLPFAAEEEVVVFWNRGDWNDAEFLSIRPEMDGFRHVATYRALDVGLQQPEAPARFIPAIYASPELFQVLGVSPVMGPGFQEGDSHVGSERVAVISHALWRELGADPRIVGEQIELAGYPFTVAGVMPAGFWFPDPNVKVWLAQQLSPESQSGRHSIVARLAPGMTLDGMGGPLSRITTMLGERFNYPEMWDKTQGAELTPLREHLLGHLRPALLALFGAMVVILLIACVNVAALMLGQVEGRGTELAVRSALGAGRNRLLQVMVIESAAIGLLAALAGGLLATAGFRVFRDALPLGALAENARVDWTLLVSALVIALVAATAVALVPGASIARSDLQRRLTRARTGGIAGRGGTLEGGMVIAQVALVLLMASGAALLIRSVGNLRAIDPGVETEGIGVVDVLLPATLSLDERVQALSEMSAAVGALPGVASAAAVQRLPLSGGGDNWGITVESRPELEVTTTAFRMVTPNYFRTLGVRLLSGRDFLESDRLPGEDGAIIVNQALVDRYLPGRDPIGERIGHGSGWMTIVGVVENVAEVELRGAPEPARYILYDHSPGLLTTHSIAFRTRDGADPVPLLDAARRTVQGVNPGVAIREVTTMRSIFDRAIGPARQLMLLLTLLSGLALVLGVVGVYGVVSQYVGRRRREWAVRLALGQHPGRVIGQIVRRGGLLVSAGIGLGLLAFLFLARVLASFLYGVGSLDPLSLLAAAAVLLAAGLLAASIPAWRTSRIDPALVLREQ